MNDLIKKYEDILQGINKTLKDIPMCDKELKLSGTAAAYTKIIKDLKELPKRRPYLFLITTQHNDEYTCNSMVYYLEPNQDPREFKEESAAHLRSVYGSGTISLRSIKI